MRLLLLSIIMISKMYCSKDCSIFQRPHKFYKIRNCFKSTLPIIAWRSNVDVDGCIKFAREKSGLAFNFSPPETFNLSKNPYIRNCQVLGCPEVGNSSTLVLDPLYNYYSVYGNLSAAENSTCMKSIGLFSIEQLKRNYTEAALHCQSLGADLADILIEQKTHFLSTRLQSLPGWYKAAYVGLDDIKVEGNFETAIGNLLKCTKYRAWSPGHPRRGRKHDDCVILDSKVTWRAINCRIKLPSICEFYPNSPEQSQFEIRSVNCTKIRNKKKKKKCLRKKELFELYNTSSRIDQCALLNDFDY